MENIKYYKNIFNDSIINGSASLGAADPFIFKYNGYYYLTCTREKELVIMKSFDLIYWENIGDNGMVSHDGVEHAYAPEIAYINGRFYIVTSPSGNGHFIYSSEKIDGPFEKVTDNFNELIDGSFYVDSDLNNYLLRATETGIAMKQFNGNKIEKGNVPYFSKSVYFLDSVIGPWTEGPYLIKRYGTYYLTFTGTHFLSDAYRVDYCSGKSLKDDGLKYQGRLAISTTKEFYGLGHSMNFVGPNLDSYYIVYHNMMDNSVRYANISRLMFDKAGHMMINGLGIDKNLMFARPDFETFVDERNYLSSLINKRKTYSLEYNFIGDEAKLILGYQDENTYCYINVSNAKLTLNQIENGNKVVLLEKDIKNLQRNFYHCIRVQYAKARISIYLDNVEFVLKEKVTIPNGKFGFVNNDLEHAYIAYSHCAYGSSDKEDIKIDSFFIDNLRYRNGLYYGEILIKEEGLYDFFNEEDGCLLIDNVPLYNHSATLKEGIHKVIYSGKSKKISYSINNSNQTDLDEDNFIANCDVFHRYEKVGKGIYFENDRNAILTKFNTREYEFSSNLEIIGNPVRDDTFAGLICEVNNYAKVNPFENAFSLEGFMLVCNSKYLYVIKANFNRSEVLYKEELKSRKEMTLKIKREKNRIKFYKDNKKIYQLTINPIKDGKCGLYMNHASALFKNFQLINK